MAAEIEGTTTIEGWRAGLDAVQKRHPLLSVCIEGKEGSTLHFRHMAGAPIPLRIIQGDTQAHWELEIERELATPFALEQVPLIRAVLLHQAPRSVFILTAHHSIGDGISSSFLVRDVLRALSKLTMPRSHMP